MELVLLYVIILTLVSFSSIVLTEHSPIPSTVSDNMEKEQLPQSIPLSFQEDSKIILDSNESLETILKQPRVVDSTIELNASSLVVVKESILSY